MFFTNRDGTINYQQMIVEIEKAIREGYERFSQTKKQASRNRNRYFREHDEKKCVDTLRKNISKMYKSDG